MKRTVLGATAALALLTITLPVFSTAATEKSNNIEYPNGWRNWATLAVSHRIDNNTIRAILGNDRAIEAAEKGQTNPWPDGTMIAKVVWKEKNLEDWEDAVVPGKLVHTEFMMKDSKLYFESYGWGWARWLGEEQKPFNEGPGSCISCHEPVKEKDWVFSEPAVFPGSFKICACERSRCGAHRIAAAESDRRSLFYRRFAVRAVGFQQTGCIRGSRIYRVGVTTGVIRIRYRFPDRI